MLLFVILSLQINYVVLLLFYMIYYLFFVFFHLMHGMVRVIENSLKFHWINLNFLVQCMEIQWWTRPTIAVLPQLWRFLQQLRRYRDFQDKWHLVNAAKYLYVKNSRKIPRFIKFWFYSSSFLVSSFSLMRQDNSGITNPSIFYLWLISILFTTCFNSYWDIVRDWSLGSK